VIIDSSKGYTADRKPMKADAILMHRSKNIIAMRASQTETSTIVQVFDLDTKSKLKQAEIPEAVVFWKYITLTKIACIGKTAVYHLDITN